MGGAGFKTDTSISGHAGDVRERELLKWTPDHTDDSAALGYPLDGHIAATLSVVMLV